MTPFCDRTPSLRAGINWGGAFIVTALSLMLMFCLWSLVYKRIPETNQNALLLLIGILARDFGAVVSWFFSGSLTGRQKDETINKMAKTLPVAKNSADVTLEPGESVAVEAEK